MPVMLSSHLSMSGCFIADVHWRLSSKLDCCRCLWVGINSRFDDKSLCTRHWSRTKRSTICTSRLDVDCVDSEDVAWAKLITAQFWMICVPHFWPELICVLFTWRKREVFSHWARSGQIYRRKETVDRSKTSLVGYTLCLTLQPVTTDAIWSLLFVDVELNVHWWTLKGPHYLSWLLPS